ncbi:MAG: hypothetical protein PVI31_00320 [Gemmatimonadota bacterium]
MRPAFQMLSALAVGVMLAVPPGAAGQTVPSPFSFVERKQEVGPFFGYMNASTGRFGYAPSGGLWYGGRYALQLGTGPMSLEGVAGLVDGTRDIIDPNQPEGSRAVGEGDVQIATVQAGLRFSATGNRSWHALSPFLSIGAGVAFDLADTPQANALLEERDIYDFGTSFFGTLGLGSRLFLTEQLALRGDGTFSLWRVGTPPGFSDSDRPFEAVDDREWVRGLSGTITLMYRW